jgi:hypothetical protein
VETFRNEVTMTRDYKQNLTTGDYVGLGSKACLLAIDKVYNFIFLAVVADAPSPCFRSLLHTVCTLKGTFSRRSL